MKLADILNKLDYETASSPENPEISSLRHDSRSVAPGALFFCLPGLSADGHKFAAAAVKNGAAAVVAQRTPDGWDFDSNKSVPLIVVENARAALSVCAANFYGNPADKLKLVGVTGTNGKTSTAYMIEAVLLAWGANAGLIGTVNTRCGGAVMDVHFDTSTTPDSIDLQQILAQMKARGAEYVVMEASSHALALDKLFGMRFAASVFTNLTQDHLDFHHTMEEYAAAKARLFDMSDIGVINADDAAASRMLGRCARSVTFGIDKPGDLKAENVRFESGGMSFDLNIGGETHAFFLPVRGLFSVHNALGAIGAALALGVPAPVIKSALAGFAGVPGRIQSVPNGRGVSVIVDYAHTPDGLENIIKAVREFTKGRVITVFGCGGDRDRTKRPVMGQLAGALSDYCVITSDNPRSEDPDAIIAEVEAGIRGTKCPYEKEPDRARAICRAIGLAAAGDSVIIAGKGHEDYQIFRDRTIHFDDYEIARQALS